MFSLPPIIRFSWWSCSTLALLRDNAERVSFWEVRLVFRFQNPSQYNERFVRQTLSMMFKPFTFQNWDYLSLAAILSGGRVVAPYAYDGVQTIRCACTFPWGDWKYRTLQFLSHASVRVTKLNTRLKAITVRATCDPCALSCTVPLCWIKQRTNRQHHEVQCQCSSRVLQATPHIVGLIPSVPGHRLTGCQNSNLIHL